MANFPLREAQITALATSVIGGLETNPADFPSPPAAPDEVQAALEAFNAAAHSAEVAAGKAKEATAAKKEALAVLVDLVKSDLRYAENHTRGDHAKLKSLGWGGRRPRRPRERPAQPMGTEIVREDPTSITLAWKPPVDGGRPNGYAIERRKRGKERWETIATSVELEITLDHQERGVELEYRVKAFNKSGKGPAGAEVRAVL